MANGTNRFLPLGSTLLTLLVGVVNLLITQCVNTRVSTLSALVKVKHDAYLNQLGPLREQTREFLLFTGRVAGGLEKGNVSATANEHRVKLRMLVASARPMLEDSALAASAQEFVTAIDQTADDVISGQAEIRHDEDTQAILDAWGAFQADVFRVLEVSALGERLTRSQRKPRQTPAAPASPPKVPTNS